MKHVRILLAAVIISSILLFLVTGHALAFGLNFRPDDFGAYHLSGEETTWDRLESEGPDYSEKGVGLEVGFYLGGEEKYKLYLRAEFRDYDAESLGVERCGSSLGLGVSLRREFRLGPVIPYAGLYCGLSYISPRHEQPELEESGLLGNLSGFLGVEIPITERFSLAYEYFWDHLSDILDDDDGGRYQKGHLFCVRYKYRNLGAWILGLFR
jgi:hypothetical protein